MKKVIAILFMGALLSCNKEEKVADTILNKTETTTKEKAEMDTDFSSPSETAPNNAVFKMNFGGELILDKEDLSANLTFTKKAITVELTQGKNKLLFGMKGDQIFSQKPFSGVFTPSPAGNKKMAFMILSVLEDGSESEFKKMPIVFEGDFKIIKLTQGELIAEISGKGSIMEEISVPEKWKPITAKIICKNPKTTAVSVKKEELYY